MVDIDFLESHLHEKLISPATELLLQATLGMCENHEFYNSCKIFRIESKWHQLQHNLKLDLII